MAVKRTYNIPLRKGTQKAPKYRRAKKAILVLKEFIKKHMKSDKILLGKNLNLKIWEKGIKNPPHHVKVHIIKEDDGTVKAELEGFKFEEKKAEKKEKEAPKTPIQEKLDKLKEKTEKIEKKKEKKEEPKKEEKKEKPKAEKKEQEPKAEKKPEEKKADPKKEETKKPKPDKKPAKKE